MGKGGRDASASSRVYTAEQVQAHQTESDCWLVIKNKVRAPRAG
jgi:cytochrome b involved in lipid metabolism